MPARSRPAAQGETKGGSAGPLGRPFNPVLDRTYFGPGFGLLSDSIGRRYAVLSAIGAGVACVAVLVAMPLSVLRLTRLVDRHRDTSIRAVMKAPVWRMDTFRDRFLTAYGPQPSSAGQNALGP